MTDPEQKLWYLLRGRRFSSHKFRRQVPIGRYIADFACFEARLIVEADGGQHCESTHDAVRDAWLTAQGFRIRRFWNADIMTKPGEVADTLWHDLQDTPHPPAAQAPSPARGEGKSSTPHPSPAATPSPARGEGKGAFDGHDQAGHIP